MFSLLEPVITECVYYDNILLLGVCNLEGRDFWTTASQGQPTSYQNLYGVKFRGGMNLFEVIIGSIILLFTI